MLLGIARGGPVFVELGNDPAADEIAEAVLLGNGDALGALARQHVGLGPPRIERALDHLERAVLSVAQHVGRDSVAAVLRLPAEDLNCGRHWLTPLQALHDVWIPGTPELALVPFA